MSEDSRGPKTQRVTIDDLALRAGDDLLQEGGGPNAPNPSSVRSGATVSTFASPATPAPGVDV